MTKKKTILALTLAAALAAGTSSVDAWAHGHGSSRKQAAYKLCAVEDCNVMGLHQHNGTYYCGHYIGDGHDYHEACAVKGCVITVQHEHDGAVCLPCTGSGLGEGVYALCQEEDCHIVGQHEHDGVYYCGHFIGDGHDYHETCTVAGCQLTVEHEHDGVVCLPCAKTGTGSCHSSRRSTKGHCH